jgi:hypothetical protein
MKVKIIKAIFIIIGCYLAYCLVFRSNHHHSTASDYHKIIRKLHVNLPDIADVESWDNYDRGASRWDCLEHKIKFATPLSEKTIMQLDRKAARPWNKWYRECRQTSVLYTYCSEESWESDAYFYHCDIIDDLEGDNDCLYIEYCIDEDEVLFNILKYLGLIILWGITYKISMSILKRIIKNA